MNERCASGSSWRVRRRGLAKPIRSCGPAMIGCPLRVSARTWPMRAAAQPELAGLVLTGCSSVAHRQRVGRNLSWHQFGHASRGAIRSMSPSSTPGPGLLKPSEPIQVRNGSACCSSMHLNCLISRSVSGNSVRTARFAVVPGAQRCPWPALRYRHHHPTCARGNPADLPS